MCRMIEGAVRDSGEMCTVEPADTVGARIILGKLSMSEAKIIKFNKLKCENESL